MILSGVQPWFGLGYHNLRFGDLKIYEEMDGLDDADENSHIAASNSNVNRVVAWADFGEGC